MDYEKKYKESMAKMSTFLAKHDGFTISKDGEMYKELSEIFPELKESEDEKMRKWLIAYLENRILNTGIVDEKRACKDAIAWLEKQGEQKYAWSEEYERIYRGLHNLIYSTPYCDSRKELSDFLDSLKNRVQSNLQQEWSEEDEKCIRLSTDIIDSALRAGFCVQLDRDRCVNWLKCLKDRVQPKQEWSEEDEQMLTEIVKDLQVYKSREISRDAKDAYQNEIDWLKSLRPQSQWKPSEEQMNALDDVISSRDIKYDVLSELWKDLKKLREG